MQPQTQALFHWAAIRSERAPETQLCRLMKQTHAHCWLSFRLEICALECFCCTTLYKLPQVRMYVLSTVSSQQNISIASSANASSQCFEKPWPAAAFKHTASSLAIGMPSGHVCKLQNLFGNHGDNFWSQDNYKKLINVSCTYSIIIIIHKRYHGNNCLIIINFIVIITLIFILSLIIFIIIV